MKRNLRQDAASPASAVRLRLARARRPESIGTDEAAAGAIWRNGHAAAADHSRCHPSQCTYAYGYRLEQLASLQERPTVRAALARLTPHGAKRAGRISRRVAAFLEAYSALVTGLPHLSAPDFEQAGLRVQITAALLHGLRRSQGEPDVRLLLPLEQPHTDYRAAFPKGIA